MQPFISLELLRVYLEKNTAYKYKQEYDRLLRGIEESPVLKSILDPIYQEETMEELREIEGIKFYNTPKMGIACLLSEINIAITGQANGSFKRKMLDYEHIKEAFKEPDMRNKQIQKLGTDERTFVSLDLVRAHLKGTKPRRYKERYKTILQEIEENFSSHLKDTVSDSDTTIDSDITVTPTQPKLPGVEKTYSYLYIAKGLDTESSPHRIREIHFGITADGLKDRIKDIEKGNYYVGELVATIAFEGTKTRNDGSIIASEDCEDLEKWFKTNPDWESVRGKKETFLYKEPWISLLENIEKSEKMGPPFYALYSGDPVITDLVPPHLISKVHDFGESLEMIEIAR